MSLSVQKKGVVVNGNQELKRNVKHKKNLFTPRGRRKEWGDTSHFRRDGIQKFSRQEPSLAKAYRTQHSSLSLQKGFALILSFSPIKCPIQFKFLPFLSSTSNHKSLIISIQFIQTKETLMLLFPSTTHQFIIELYKSNKQIAQKGRPPTISTTDTHFRKKKKI